MDILRKKVMDKWLVEAVVQRCSVKKVFLEISQNLRETAVPAPRF